MKQILLGCALALCILSTAVGENTQSEGMKSWSQEWQELAGQIGKGVTVFCLSRKWKILSFELA